MSDQASEPMGDFPLDRVPERVSARQPVRRESRPYVPPPPHRKYHIDPRDIPPGMDALWLPTRIGGEPNRQVGQYYRSGWQPATAEMFPEISGYGVEFPANMVEAGLLENVRADAPIVVDDQMLVLRPKELSRAAAAEHERQSHDQVAIQMQRLKQVSRDFRGTEIRRRHAPMPDMAPREDEEYA